MKYEDFQNYLNQKLKGKGVNEKRIILEKIKHAINDEYKKIMLYLSNYETDNFKDYTLCSKCNEYSLNKDFEIINDLVEREELVYMDSGYGDDDEYGKVLYWMTYSICPKCKNKKRIKEVWMGRKY